LNSAENQQILATVREMVEEEREEEINQTLKTMQTNPDSKFPWNRDGC